MSVVGIIAEYNPLHSGHEYHITEARRLTEASACVCILSSNFVQRGEPAVVSKWARTQMALLAGADLVVELPAAFSCASAEYFAAGAVKILDSLGIVDYLCFGSEEGDLPRLEKAADILAFESDEFRSILRENLNNGLSFAAARQSALEKSFLPSGDESIQKEDNQPSKVIDKPNNILGIEYIKAMKRFKSAMKPVTIPRKGQGYNSLETAGSFSSATAIRKYIAEIRDTETLGEFDHNDRFLKSNLPQSSLKILSEEIMNGRGPVYPEVFESILLHLLRNTPSNVLSLLPYMGEGLENRLKQAAMQSVSYNELVSSTVTSRYPASRIKRILCALLTGMTAEFLDELKANGYAQYIRILGFNDIGRDLLSGIKRKVQLPIITKPANFTKLAGPLARRLFEHEIRASNAYVLGYPNILARIGGSEYTTSPLYIKS